MRIAGTILLGSIIAIVAAGPVAAADTQHLNGGMSLLIGSSCNVLILPSADGTLIVDDQRHSNYAETLAGVRQVSPAPVR
jgi:hypothetical protein